MPPHPRHHPQMATGNLHDFKCSLLIQQRAEERSLQRAGAAPASAAAAPSPPPPSAQQQQQLDGARAELVRLFRRLDTDNDGLLSKFELQMALEKAGAALADDDSRVRACARVRCVGAPQAQPHT